MQDSSHVWGEVERDWYGSRLQGDIALLFMNTSWT